jgi:hypothetical protein
MPKPGQDASSETLPVDPNTVVLEGIAMFIAEHVKAVGPEGVTLLLYMNAVAEKNVAEVSISDISKTFGCAKTTAIRWLGKLVDETRIKRLRGPLTDTARYRLSDASSVSLPLVAFRYKQDVGTDVATRAPGSKASLNSSSSNYLPKEQTTSSSNGAHADAFASPSGGADEAVDLPWPEVPKKKRTAKRAKATPSKATPSKAKGGFDPTSLPPPVFRLWSGIVLLRWQLDNVPEASARECAEIAAWLVENRDATPEQLEDWHRWWWTDPDSIGFRHKTRPWPKNVRGTWDTAKLPKPETEPTFAPGSPLAGAMEYRREALERVARMREEEARKELENDVRRIN